MPTKHSTLPLILATLFLAACGAGDTKKETPGGDSTIQPVTTTEAKVSYQFAQNGCDTGKHEFKAHDKDAATKLLCEGLQDEALNKSCAPVLRKSFFESNCSGTFTPKYPPVNPQPEPQPEPQPLPPEDDQDDERIPNLTLVRAATQALTNRVLDSFQVSSRISGDEAMSVNAFMGEMKLCGLSYSGPRCLERTTLIMNQHAYLFRMGEKAFFVTELTIKGISVPLLYIYEVEIDASKLKVKSNSFRVFKEIQRFQWHGLKRYLEDSSASVEIASGELAEHAKPAAIARMHTAKEIRTLFYMARLLLDPNQDDARDTTDYSKDVVNVLLEKREVIIQSKLDIFQEYLLAILASHGANRKAEINRLCDGLVSSGSDSVKQIAATYILTNDPSREDVKPLVRKAFSFPTWATRFRAVKALAQARPNLEDQILIIGKLEDADSDIAGAAMAAADGFSLQAAHIPALKKVAASNVWSARFNATKLLSKIDHGEARLTLINQLKDGDVDVRNKAAEALQKAKLTQEEVPALASLLKNQPWDVRYKAVLLLGKIDAVNVTLILIDSMADGDSDIQAAINKELGRRKLTASMVDALAKKANGEAWNVRYSAVKHLGRIAEVKSTIVLIEKMADNDSDITNEVMKHLQARPLTDDLAPLIAKHFSGGAWNLRLNTAKLLGKIKGKNALAALEAQLAVESDSDVKNAIKASIKAIKS